MPSRPRMPSAATCSHTHADGCTVLHKLTAGATPQHGSQSLVLLVPSELELTPLVWLPVLSAGDTAVPRLPRLLPQEPGLDAQLAGVAGATDAAGVGHSPLSPSWVLAASGCGRGDQQGAHARAAAGHAVVEASGMRAVGAVSAGVRRARRVLGMRCRQAVEVRWGLVVAGAWFLGAGRVVGCIASAAAVQGRVAALVARLVRLLTQGMKLSLSVLTQGMTLPLSVGWGEAARGVLTPVPLVPGALTVTITLTLSSASA